MTQDQDKDASFGGQHPDDKTGDAQDSALIDAQRKAADERKEGGYQ